MKNEVRLILSKSSCKRKLGKDISNILLLLFIYFSFQSICLFVFKSKGNRIFNMQKVVTILFNLNRRVNSRRVQTFFLTSIDMCKFNKGANGCWLNYVCM
jgi:hypothetical protein